MAHIYDRLLPSNIVLESSEVSYVNVQQLFDNIDDCDWLGLVRAAKCLKDALDIKVPLDKATRTSLIKCLLKKLAVPGIPMFEEGRLCECLVSLFNGSWPLGEDVDIRMEWRPLLDRFLKQHKLSGRVVESNNGGRTQGHRRAMLSLMREARRHYPPQTAIEVWEYCCGCLRLPQQQESFLALATLHLMSPTEHSYYDDLMPKFLEVWAGVERCPEWDLLWLSMLSRARKHTNNFNWRKAEPAIFAALQRFLVIQFGEAPVVGDRRSPAIVHIFLSGIDVQVSRVTKLAKLVTFCLCTHGDSPDQNTDAMACLLRIIKLGKVYFYPSNPSACTSRLVAFCTCLVEEIAKCLGKRSVDRNWPCMSPSQVFTLVDFLTPLLKQGVFSQNRNISASCNSALRTVAFMAPCRVGPGLIEFMVLSLGDLSTNSTHMFPAGISLLASLIQPLLYPVPLIASSLPRLLHLSLKGIDPNNQQKTMNTLSMYKELLQWLAIGEDALHVQEPLSRDFLGKYDSEPFDNAQITDSVSFIGEALVAWAPEFMNKMFYMLQSQETPAESSTSIDQRLMGRQSALIRELCHLFFKRMHVNVHRHCATLLAEFVTENQVPNAVKDVSFFVEACVSAEPSVIDLFILPLTKGVFDSNFDVSISARELSWRIRILRGALRYAGISCVKHAKLICDLLDATTEHIDKDVSKAACKLLRSTLQGMVETYPLRGNTYEALKHMDKTWTNLSVSWHQCSESEFIFASQLLERYMLEPLTRLGATNKLSHNSSCLRKVLQCMRGAAGMIHDLEGGDDALFDTSSAYGRHHALDVSKKLLEIRQTVAKGLHEVLLLMKSEGEESIKQMKLWVKCAYAVLTMRGSVSHCSRSMVARYRSLVPFYSDPVKSAAGAATFKAAILSGEVDENDIKAHDILHVGSNVPVHLMLSRLWAHFAIRQDVGARAVVSAMRNAEKSDSPGLNSGYLAKKLGVYDDLIGDIISLALGRYATVRATAQRHLPWCSHTWLLKRRLGDIVKLVGGSESYEQSAGAAYILLDARFIRKVASDPNLSSELLLRICSSGQLASCLPATDKERVVALCFELLASYLAQWNESTSISVSAAKLELDLLELLNPTGNISGHEKKALSWRHELAATWCLLHCFRGQHSPSEASWHWFVSCLSSGDGHPQQKLGLYSIAKLMSLHIDRRAIGQIVEEEPVILALLKSSSSCKSIFEALAFDRRGGASRGLWSSGVTAIVNEASKSGNPRFPKSRLPFASAMFKSKHARFSKLWFRMVGMDLLPPMEESFQWFGNNCRIVDPADKRAFTCAASEVFAGILRETTINKALQPNDMDSVWNFVLPILEFHMKDASFEISADWADAVRFVVAKRPPFSVSPLVDAILTHVRHDLTDGSERNDYSTQSKWIRLLQSLLAEWGSDPQCEAAFCTLAEEVVPLLLSIFTHSYQMLRVMVGKTMFLFLDFPCFAQCLRLGVLRSKTLSTILSLLDTGLQINIDSKVEEKKLRLARESTGHWIVTCALGGDSGVHSWWHLALLPRMFEGLLDENIEHQKFVRSIIQFMAQSVDKCFDSETINSLTTNASWKVREESVRYIGVTDTRLNANSAQVMLSLFPLLGDIRLEVAVAVRDVASLVFMADLPSPHGTHMITRLMKNATEVLKQIKRIKTQKTTTTNLAPAERAVNVNHSVRYCVNGLSALILSSPFDISDPIVSAIGVLARLASSGGDEAQAAVRHCFMEFKRTHLDNWDEHRMCFDQSTLDAFNETFEAPSYFC